MGRPFLPLPDSPRAVSEVGEGVIGGRDRAGVPGDEGRPPGPAAPGDVALPASFEVSPSVDFGRGLPAAPATVPPTARSADGVEVPGPGCGRPVTPVAFDFIARPPGIANPSSTEKSPSSGVGISS